MSPAQNTAVQALPLERSGDQGLMLKHMAVLNQHLLSAWQDTDGQLHARLTLQEAIAQVYEWSTEYAPGHPELARDFAVIAGDLSLQLQAETTRQSRGRYATQAPSTSG